MYLFLIGWISYALCVWTFTYATDHAVLKINTISLVVQYNFLRFSLESVACWFVWFLKNIQVKMSAIMEGSWERAFQVAKEQFEIGNLLPEQENSL